MTPAVKLILISLVSAGLGAGIATTVVTIHYQQKTSELEQRLLVEIQKADDGAKERQKAMQNNAGMPGDMTSPLKRRK